MDAYQQTHRYLRPPPPPPLTAQAPPTADHHHLHYLHQQQQQPPPPPAAPRPPVPSHAHQWYSNQFHYQPPSSHSPSPPPPTQWAPPPAPSAAYPPHPPLPYPAHHHPSNNNNGYRLPPRPPQISQSYPQTNQDWGNSNWTHHNQGWDYTAHNNTQDWAARAKEWANARAAMENQHMQSQFTPVGRPEEQTRFGDNYPPAADFQFAGTQVTQQQSGPVPGHQPFPVQATPSHQPPVAYQQETTSMSSVPSLYVPDMQLAYSGRDGASAGEANVGLPLQESLHSSPSVYQQEVPSSYSSVTGKEETADQMEHTYRSIPVPISSAQEEHLFAYGNQAADATTDLSDKPLDFAPRFNHEHNLHMPSSYVAHQDSTGTVRSLDPAAAVTSVNSWTSTVAPGLAYPPIPPVVQAGPQHDPSIAIAPAPGPPAHQYGGFPGQGFQPSIASASAFGLSAGAAVHPPTAFPGDTYGFSSVPERPKKAPVPNWLKEEIIKNKASITKSSLDNPKEGTESVEDDTGNKSSGKNEHADSKSIDSSRSTEEEDDDEDYVEAARTAAINQEIKRILTEVLLKVTDELFDEIASKVLSEDDLTIEVDRSTLISNHKVSPPSPAVPTPKASAKVLVPVKAKENETEVSSGRTNSGSPGDVLGLGNYASDDDAEDDEIQSSSMQNTRNNDVRMSSLNKLSEDTHDAAENGSVVELQGHNKVQKYLKNAESLNAISGESKDENNVDLGNLWDVNNDSGLKSTLGEKSGMKIKSEPSDADVSVKKSTNSQSTETRMKSVKNDRHESEKGFSRKDSGKEQERGRRADELGDENRRREDERHLRKEKTDARNDSRDKMKEQGVKPEEKAKESKSRKRSTHLGVNNDRKDGDKHHRASTKEGIDKNQRSKEEDAGRHKHTSDSSRHKRRRSSSISSKGRNSKDNSISHPNGSSDEMSDDSKRKPHSRKRNLSPSPVRSRRRQVTRSPHSKHSQRRHSPYSSLETTRGRRSKSRSPVRRQR